MTSNDVLTVDEFRVGLEGLKVYIDGRFIDFTDNVNVLDRKVEALRTDVQVLARDVRDIDSMRDFIGWGFGLMALVIAGLYNELCNREKDKEGTVSWNKPDKKD